MSSRRIILTDGTEISIEGKQTISMLSVMIGASGIDTVMLPDRIHVMLVDDRGHHKNLPVNEKATAIYLQRCHPGTTHQIRGEVAIVPDEDFAS